MELDKKDALVGALVVLTAVLLLTVLFYVNHRRFTADTYHVNISLSDISGIEEGIGVIYKGFKAGAVDQVKISYEPAFRFIVRLAIKKEIRLKEGTTVLVRNKGFGGAKSLELSPPPEDAPGGIIKEGALLSVGSETDLMQHANMVLGRVEDVIKNLQKNEPGSHIRETLEQVRALALNTNRLLGSANLMIDESRTDLKGSLSQTRELAGELNRFMVKNREPLDQIIQRLNTSMSHMPAIMQNTEELTAELKKHPWRLVWKSEPKAPKAPKEPAPKK
ncbi:MAG TPA: MlaD family protein [Elusimicrobiales bacterium]|nr:MlaD family protein [Elusimicrobiales bacterium]